MDIEKIGDYHYNKAHEELNKFNWWIFGPSSDEKHIYAIDNYIIAAEKYELGKLYEKAGNAFHHVASLYYNRMEYYYAAGFYIQAAKMYKFVDNILTEAMLNTAIKIYRDINSFDLAGKYTEMLIDIRNDLNINYKLSLYYNAYNYYKLANLKYEMKCCLEKINTLKF